MSRRSSRVVGALLLAAAAARADLDVVIANGDSVRGTLLPADETETFRFACPEGARISVTVGAKTSRLKMGVTLLDPDGAVVAGATGRHARIAGARAERAGEFRVAVSSADGVTAGDYAVKLKWRSARVFARTAQVAGNATEVLEFSADAGADVTFTLAPGRHSSAVPSLVRVRAADATTFPLSPGLRSTFKIPSTGTYTLTFENEAAAAGDVVARASVRPPTARSRKLLATTREIPEGADVVAAAVLDGAGGDLRGPVSGPLAGALVTVPPGALLHPAIIVLATTPDLEPPLAWRSLVATPAAFVGPMGLTFEEAPHPTVALPVSFAEPVPLDASLHVYATDAQTPIDEVPDANTDGEAITFDATRLASFQGWYLRQPELAPPIVFETMSDRALGPVAMGGGFVFVGSPNSHLQSGAGEGLVRVFQRVAATWVERSPLRSPVVVDQDKFGVAVAYRHVPDTSAAGDSLLVSARDANGPLIGLDAESPAIYEYVRSGDEWVYLQTLPSVAGSQFAADGDRLVVVPEAVVGAKEFKRTPQGWTAGQTIDPPTGYGLAATLQVLGDMVLIGYPTGPSQEPGAAYRFDLSVAPAAQISRYEPLDPPTTDPFAPSLALATEYVAVLGRRFTSSVHVFRRFDDGRETSLPRPVLLEYRTHSPSLSGALALEGTTLVVGAGNGAVGFPFAGAYVYRRAGRNSWPLVFTLDAAPAIGVGPRERATPSGIAREKTTVAIPINVYDSDSLTSRSAIAFFEIQD